MRPASAQATQGGVDLTARSFARFARTTAIYEVDTVVEGITVPSRIAIVSDLEDKDRIHALDGTRVDFGE